MPRNTILTLIEASVSLMLAVCFHLSSAGVLFPIILKCANHRRIDCFSCGTLGILKKCLTSRSSLGKLFRPSKVMLNLILKYLGSGLICFNVLLKGEDFIWLYRL